MVFTREVVTEAYEMNKDKLLDYTAVHNIEADYNMSKRKLKKLIKQSEEN